MKERLARTVLVLAVTLSILSIMTILDTPTEARFFFCPFILPPNSPFNFTITVPPEVNGQAQVMLLLTSNATVEVELVSSQSGNVVFSKTSQDFYAVLSLPSGEYSVYVINDGPSTASGILYLSYLPAPVGIADYGVKIVGNGIEPYVEKFYGVIGIAEIYSYSVSKFYNRSSSLQLNTVLQINTAYGSQQLWLQNTVSLFGGKNKLTYNFVDNIWNMTAPFANVSPALVRGDGSFTTSGGQVPQTFYYFCSQNYTSALPLKLVLLIGVRAEQGSVVVEFGYLNTTSDEAVWYDNATITASGLESAYLLVDGYNWTGSYNAYDTELVFGGLANGENVSFTNLNASLELLYYNGTFFYPQAVFPFGLDTAEEAYNLETFPGDGAYEVTTGYGIGLPLSLTQPFSLNVINYTRVVDEGQEVKAAVSVSGAEGPYALVVSFEGKNYSYVAFTPGICYIGVPANVTGTHELTITAYTLTGQEITKDLTITVNPPPALKVKVRNVTDVGAPITVNYNVSGGTPPYNVTILVNGVKQESNIVNFTKPGEYNITVVVRDSVGMTVEHSLTITVNPRPQIELALSRNATDVGIPVYISYNVTGGTKPYKVTLLLNGTAINNKVLNVTEPGTYVIEAIVTDSINITSLTKEVLIVNPRPSVSVTPSYQGNLLVSVTSIIISAEVNGGTPPYTYYVFLNGKEVYQGPEVQEVKLNVSTGTYNVTVEVVDGLGVRASYTTMVNSSYNYTLIGGIASAAVLLATLFYLVVKRKR